MQHSGSIITPIITIMIIILVTIIIDQIATSIFFTQVKPPFSSNTFPIYFISTTVSYGSTLQPETSIFFAKFSDWSTKSKTLTASPRFLRYFSSSLKTNSHHMLSAKSTNSITSPNSGSSSTDTLQSSQLKFQPPSNIPLPFLSTATSWCTPTFPSSPTPATHSLYFYSSIYILPSSRT